MHPSAATCEAIQLSVAGPFDLTAARRIANALIEASEETLVRIDLTRVSHFDDSGVAMLGRALARHRRAEVSGLRRHQVLLLGYLGIEGFGSSRDAAEPAWTS